LDCAEKVKFDCEPRRAEKRLQAAAAAPVATEKRMQIIDYMNNLSGKQRYLLPAAAGDSDLASTWQHKAVDGLPESIPIA
jgi:hypothetical protein